MLLNHLLYLRPNIPLLIIYSLEMDVLLVLPLVFPLQPFFLPPVNLLYLLSGLLVGLLEGGYHVVELQELVEVSVGVLQVLLDLLLDLVLDGHDLGLVVEAKEHYGVEVEAGCVDALHLGKILDNGGSVLFVVLVPGD